MAARVTIVASGALLLAFATDVLTCSHPSVPAPGDPDVGGPRDEVSALQVALVLGRGGDRGAAGTAEGLQAQESRASGALATLPSVDCVRVISLNGSSALPLIKEDLQRVGLWERTTVQTVQRDPDGGEAGCFRSHAQAWRESQGCSHLLVLEDDAFFDPASVDQCTAHAEAFLQSGVPYDMLFLGWNNWLFTTNVSRISSSECSYRLHGWLGTHAYIISQQTRQEWANLEYEGKAIDQSLSYLHDRDRFTTVRPSCAFQRNHKTSIAWDRRYELQRTIEQSVWQAQIASPAYMHSAQEAIYAVAGEAADAERCNGAAPSS